jgi:hypothetical protein
MAGKVLNIKVCSPLKQRNGLTGKCHAICHCSYNFPLGARQRKARTMKEILLANRKMKGKATAQIAHLVFANTQANPEKPKELFFANARTKTSIFTN